MAPYLVGDRLLAAWGGSMALRRADFDRSGVRDIWRTALDDDLTLATAIRRIGLRVEFVAECMTISSEECTMHQYYEWLKRHFFFVRLYSPALWISSFVSFVPMFLIFAGLVLLVGSVVVPDLLLPALTLLVAVPLQIVGGMLTALVFRDYRTALWVPLAMFYSGGLAVAARFNDEHVFRPARGERDYASRDCTDGHKDIEGPAPRVLAPVHGHRMELHHHSKERGRADVRRHLARVRDDDRDHK
jgi:Glycosyl transferase family 21